MKKLQDKVAIITGASSGIGYATARLFAKEGAKLILTARREALLQELTAGIINEGGQAVYLAGDISKDDHVEALVQLALKRFGKLDIAFNNAGTLGASAPTESLTVEQWSETINTNLTSSFLCAKHQIPALQKNGGGNILFTSSFVGHTIGFPGMAAYAASKAGQIGLVKVMAAELGPQGIRVNAILPGGTDTPMNIANDPSSGPEVRDFLNGLHALKRLASPEEIAKAALYLVSEEASFITGTATLVDGGASITKT